MARSWQLCALCSLLALGCSSREVAVADAQRGDARRDVAAVDTSVDRAPEASVDTVVDLPPPVVSCSITSQPSVGGAGLQYDVTVTVRGLSSGSVALERSPGGAIAPQPIINGAALFKAVDFQPGMVTLRATVVSSGGQQACTCVRSLVAGVSIPPCTVRFDPAPAIRGGQMVLPAPGQHSIRPCAQLHKATPG